MLTNLKRMTYDARRDYQNLHQPPQWRHEGKQACDNIWRLYTNAIKATRRECLRDFMTEQAQSNMWGEAYCYQRMTPTEAMNVVTMVGSLRLAQTSTCY